MASKDSGELQISSGYTLGDYSFRIERSPGTSSDYDKIEAICTDKDGKNARKSIQVRSSAQVECWYVEANETEATVYAKISSQEPTIPYLEVVCDQPDRIPSQLNPIDPYHSLPVGTVNGKNLYIEGASANAILLLTAYNGGLYAALSPSSPTRGGTPRIATTSAGSSRWHLFDYFRLETNGYANYVHNLPVSPVDPSGKYPEPSVKGGDYLVGRFAIKLEDAGGGPDNPGGWIDPGDWEDGWEEGDPTHTLYVTVTGALSGRHNDPIEDPSYSYIPADKDTIKDYGCGGDGGHGGGGGAGASTVVIHKFATNQADDKEIVALAKRHGYGSGGGKGGKGGDGCILVYY